MLAEERRYRIVEILNERESGLVSVTELSDLLKVSTMTIRRDLDWLEERDLLRRVHGGAVVREILDDERPFRERGKEFSQEKQLVGRMAAQLVHDGEVIILDAGTTTQQVARHLGDKQDLTVVTNAMPVAEELSRYPQISTILLGGILKHRELCTVGPPVTDELSRLSADKLFLSAAGFAPEKGATDPDLRETEVKQAMIRAARQVILVTDSSKWGVVTFAQITTLDAIHKVVSDDAIPADAIEALEAEGVEIITPRSSVASYQRDAAMSMNHPTQVTISGREDGS
jgi:DeoR family fructose operon transcriptional repressor